MPVDSAGNVFLGNAHLIRWPHLFTVSLPKGETDQSKATFNAVGILSGNEPKFAQFREELMAELDRASIAKFGAPVPDMISRGRFKLPVTQNADPNHGRANKPGFAERPNGLWFAASTRFAVPVQDMKRLGMSKDRESETYDGMFGQIMVSAWGWDHPTGGKGLSLNLNGVWKQFDGDRLGGGGADISELTDDGGFVPEGASSAPSPDGGGGQEQRDPSGTAGGDGATSGQTGGGFGF